MFDWDNKCNFLIIVAQESENSVGVYSEKCQKPQCNTW